MMLSVRGIIRKTNEKRIKYRICAFNLANSAFLSYNGLNEKQEKRPPAAAEREEKQWKKCAV